jgi:hypothetical protein
MARRRGDAELQVRTSFEAAWTATQCLSAAYDRLVPTPSIHPIPKTVRAESLLNVVIEAKPRLRRRVERG